MTDLIDGFFLTLAGKQFIGQVKHISRVLAGIQIGMDNTWWDYGLYLLAFRAHNYLFLKICR